MPRRDRINATEPTGDLASVTSEKPLPDAFYRIPFSTAEAEALLATLIAFADTLDGWGAEDSPLAPQVHALRLSSALLRSAGNRVRDELPDFLSVRAGKEAEKLATLFAYMGTGASERSKRQLLEAARDTQSAVEIEYYVPSRDQVTRRTVDVRGVFDEPGGAYLSGYCHLRRDQRVFKLENIRVVRSAISPDEALEDPFADL